MGAFRRLGEKVRCGRSSYRIVMQACVCICVHLTEAGCVCGAWQWKQALGMKAVSSGDWKPTTNARK